MAGNEPSPNNKIYANTIDGDNIQMPAVRLDDPTALVQLVDPQRPLPDLVRDPAAKMKDYVTAQEKVQEIMRALKIRGAAGFSTTRTDQQGKFVVEHIVPGRVGISDSIEFHEIGARSELRNHEIRVELKPGESTQVALGGRGRSMVGQVIAGSMNGKPFDWSGVNGVSAGLASGSDPATGYMHFVRGQIDHQGRFRIDDVIPGEYGIYVYLSPPCREIDHVLFACQMCGLANAKCTVPELPDGVNYSPEPIDLGTITASMYGGINPGDPAPDFKLPAVDGREISLSDYRGKVVVLNFWTISGGAIEWQLGRTQKIYDEYKEDPHFAMISLSMEKLERPLKDFLADHPVPWPQIQLPGGIDNPLCKEYGIHSEPVCYLIGPDGTLLASSTNLNRDAVFFPAVKKALAEWPKTP